MSIRLSADFSFFLLFTEGGLILIVCPPMTDGGFLFSLLLNHILAGPHFFGLFFPLRTLKSLPVGGLLCVVSEIVAPQEQALKGAGKSPWKTS